MVPYLDTLRWVFIAMALIGIAVAIHARIDDWEAGPAMIDWNTAIIASGPTRKVLDLLLAALSIALFLLNFGRVGECRSACRATFNLGENAASKRPSPTFRASN